MTDAQTILTYLKAKLVDPSSRGYPTSQGYHWIYISKPSISFSVLGYPIVYLDLPNTSEVGKRTGSGVVDRNRITIQVFASKMSHIDTLRESLRGLFINYAIKDLPGMFNFTVESISVTSNIIDDAGIYQMLFDVSYISMRG